MRWTGGGGGGGGEAVAFQFQRSDHGDWSRGCSRGKKPVLVRCLLLLGWIVAAAASAGSSTVIIIISQPVVGNNSSSSRTRDRELGKLDRGGGGIEAKQPLQLRSPFVFLAGLLSTATFDYYSPPRLLLLLPPPPRGWPRMCCSSA